MNLSNLPDHEFYALASRGRTPAVIHELERRVNADADTKGLPRPGYDWERCEGGIPPRSVIVKAGIHYVMNTSRYWERMSEGQLAIWDRDPEHYKYLVKE